MESGRVVLKRGGENGFMVADILAVAGARVVSNKVTGSRVVAENNYNRRSTDTHLVSITITPEEFSHEGLGRKLEAEYLPAPSATRCPKLSTIKGRRKHHAGRPASRWLLRL